MAPAPELLGQWFDGRSPRAHPVRLRIEGDALCVLRETGELRYPVAQVRWPERRSHGQRQAELPDGGLIQHADAAAWDAWAQASGLPEPQVVSWMQSWRATGAALLGAVLFLSAAWVWGVPVLSQALVRWVPPGLEQKIGERGLAQLDRLFLAPSRLPSAQQAALRQRFERLVQTHYSGGDAPPWQLGFHRADALGANAFALPGGFLVLTDDLVELLQDQPDALMGVLAHELGHVEQRHGLDLMVRASLVSALIGVVLGDASGFLATVPATLATQAYSRDAERAADEYAAQMLHQAGISPAVMAVFFERIAGVASGEGGAQREGRLPISIASHPDHSERIAFFRHWTTQPSPN